MIEIRWRGGAQGEREDYMNINGIFNPENRFWSFMDKVMDVCTISILWFVFSLPIVTIGASTTALFQYTLKLTADEEGYVLRTFVKAFLKNFVQATVLWLAGLITGAFLITDLYYCQFLGIPRAARIGLFVALVSILLVYILTMIYVFPLLSLFKVGLKKVVTNAFIMSMGNLYVSVTILVIFGIVAVLIYFMPFIFMIWFGLGCYVSSFFYRSVFHKYMPEEREETVDFEE